MRSGEFAWLTTDAPSAYDDLGLDVDEFDVIFAYPWPGEEDVVIDPFDRYAATDASLEPTRVARTSSYVGRSGPRC